MSKTLPLLLFCWLTWSLPAQERGELVSYERISQWDENSILGVYEDFELPEFFFPVHYDADLYRVVYRTPAVTADSLTLASGLVTVPLSAECDFPLVVYNHGSFLYDEVVSELNTPFEQHYFGIPFAANGYVTVIPDYLGYGATPADHLHPYIHAQTEASAVVDMLRAAKTLCGLEQVYLNDQLFLLGYSQGGHVTMALHRSLEAEHADEFTVTASAPCSGPYDVSGISRDSILYADRFAHGNFYGFILTSYQFVYGDIYSDLSEVFAPPYDEWVARIFNRENPESDLVDSLPYPAFPMLQPLFQDAILEDPDHPLNVALRENNVYDWAPLAPVRMFYCEGDERVPYLNALFTRDTMLALGAAGVEAFSAGADNDHETCTFPSLVLAKLWFDAYRIDCMVPATEVAAGTVRWYPNPFGAQVFLEWEGDDRPVFDRIRVFDLAGRQVYAAAPGRGQAITVPAADWPSGVYLFELSGEGQRIYQRLMRQ